MLLDGTTISITKTQTDNTFHFFPVSASLNLLYKLLLTLNDNLQLFILHHLIKNI